jgi:nucleotide-binding universal stress UspA family protein
VEQISAAGDTMIQSYVMLGRPDEEIVLLANEIHTGLVVVGSRGLGGMRRLLMGSLADSVVRHAHCPVFVVSQEKR